jgi:hypothetical protein
MRLILAMFLACCQRGNPELTKTVACRSSQLGRRLPWQANATLERACDANCFLLQVVEAKARYVLKDKTQNGKRKK